ncbi:MAG: 50S ribosomal protein L5 [Thermoplasmata archaeon]
MSGEGREDAALVAGREEGSRSGGGGATNAPVATRNSEVAQEATRTSNPMREPRIEKVVVNIGVGEAGEKLVKAEKVLMMVTGQKAVRTISRTTNKDLGIRRGMPLGCKVTIRGKAAENFLKTALWVKDNKIASYSFDPQGNFSFGISDYTDFPGQKYNPDIGIFGMDISVVMCRAGRRVALRARGRSTIPASHRLTRQEVMEFLKKKYGVEVVE